MNPDVCPHCGAEIPDGAKACPECGSDEQTGWSEAARSDSLGLPDETFDYDEFIKRELGEERKSFIPWGIPWYWWIITVLLLIFLAIFFCGRILAM